MSVSVTASSALRVCVRLGEANVDESRRSFHRNHRSADQRRSCRASASWELRWRPRFVIGNMIGAGILLVPSVLAPFGPNAMTAGSSNRRGDAHRDHFGEAVRSYPGLAVVYVEGSVRPGNRVIVMWSYLVSVWTANAILPIAAISNLSHIAPVLGRPIVAPQAPSMILWLMFLVNEWRSRGGVRPAGYDGAESPALDCRIAHCRDLLRARRSRCAAGACADRHWLNRWRRRGVFSMLGIESATVSADKVKNPLRTIPIASVLGAVLTGLITWQRPLRSSICFKQQAAHFPVSFRRRLAAGHRTDRARSSPFSRQSALSGASTAGSWYAAKSP